jgi:hypothetical protein
VYAFGLGGAGQLGTKGVQSATTPQVVLGPWVSPGGISVLEAGVQSEHASNCVVKSIYSGGDHCFATVTHREVRLNMDLEGLAGMIESLDLVFISSSIKQIFNSSSSSFYSPPSTLPSPPPSIICLLGFTAGVLPLYSPTSCDIFCLPLQT